MSVRGPQRLGLANQHEERSRCSSSLQLARRGLANVPSTAHTAAALQLKKAALDHHSVMRERIASSSAHDRNRARVRFSLFLSSFSLCCVHTVHMLRARAPSPPLAARGGSR